jgi:TolB-like protein
MAADPSFTGPSVVVFPFVASDRTPTLVGDAVAHSILTGMQQKPGVLVSLAPATAIQNDYLKTARSLSADYYVAGFVSTVGNKVASIAQLVSTKSGVVVWRSSDQFSVPGDAVPVGVEIHDAVVTFATPQFPTISNAPPPSPPVPKPAAPRATPQSALRIPSANDSTSAAAATAVAPAQKTVAVIPVQRNPNAVISAVVGNFGEGPQGSLDAVRHYVPTSILRTLPRYHIAGGRAELDESDIAADGLLACANAGADVILTGTMDVFDSGTDPGLGMQWGAHLVLDVYNCHNLSPKPLVFDIHTSNGDAQTAVDIAVNQALKAYAATLKSN